MEDGDGDPPLDEVVEMSGLDRMLYLNNHGSGNDSIKHAAVIKACEDGKLEVVKELVEQHNVNPKCNHL